MILLRTLSLVALALTGLFTVHSERTARSYSPADLQVLRLASSHLARQSSSRVLPWLRHQSTIRSAVLMPDGPTIDVRFRDGMSAAILSRSTGTVAQPAQPHFRTLSRTNAPGGARALVLEPFATQLGLGAEAGAIEVSDLRSAGFQVNELDDTAVTVASMATLSQYNVVYAHTHSGVTQGGDGILATGQQANNDPAVQPLIDNGSVIVAGVSGSNTLYYAITSQYIENDGQFPGNSLFFANGCNLLAAPRFWQALTSKGVAAFVSWNLEASSRDNYFAGAAFFHQMDSGATVSQAISAEQAAGYGISHVSGVTARLGFQGDGSITLQRAANPPATTAPTSTPNQPSPTPTATPKPTPGAPTATPIILPAPLATATPPAPVTLVAVLQSVVSPGRQQVIVAHTAPGMPVRFRVEYPNGDHQSARVVADAQGTARYAYTQGSSKITRQNAVATVLMRTGIGAQRTTAQQTYRILPGPLDLSAQPRDPVAGGVVHIWVHAHPHARVMLTFSVARHRIARFWTRTGPLGWAHPAVRAASGGAGKVLVVGRTSIGHRSIVSRTTFRIRAARRGR